jgi:TPR repeat protein
MSKVNMSDQLVQRPQTSQSYRRGDDPRPHTSQGHRRPEPQLSSPTSSSPHPMPPTDRPPATRNDSTSMIPNQRNFSDGQAPVRPPLNPLASARPVASFQGEPSPRLQQSQRSMTMPDEVATGMVKKKLQKNQNAQSNRQAPGTRRGSQELYNYTPAPISLDAVPRAVQQDKSASATPDENAQIEFTSPAMPNFDAIPRSANERSEDPLHARRHDVMPVYHKASYQAPIDAAPLSRSQSQPESQQRPANTPDFAGFAFNLREGSNGSTGQNQQPFQAGYKTSSPHSYDSFSPISGLQNQPRSYSGSEQNTPIPASRQGYQQFRATGSVEQYGNPNMDQSQTRNLSDVQQYPPSFQSFSTNRDPSYEYDQGKYCPQQGSQGELVGRYNQRPLLDIQRFYNHQGPYPAQIDTRFGTLDTLHQQRRQTPDSAHPAPSRQYHSRDNSASLNPDALPAHPVPVRPGLMQLSSNPSAPAAEGPGTMYQLPAANPGLTPTTSQEEKPAPITPYDLNLLLQTIKNNPNDHKTTLTLAKKLVEAASTLSSEGGKADAKKAQKNRERYILDAHKYLKKLVHQGYPEAMFYLAECHGQGSLGLQASPKEAFHLYTSAAKAGHAQAAYRVAVCCEMGSEEGGGTRRDPLKAMQWYRRAASMGDTPAMYKLGIILLKGLLGQPRNPRDALSWLKRAAEKADKDNPHALHELGMLFENASPSDSIVKDENYSRQLFTQAADLGYKFSQFRLGSVYEYGILGCPIDPRQSIAWYTRAAAQGEHQSELALSGWYLTGSDGVLQQNDTEAYLWARKAANSRLAKAEYAMGYFTEAGIGCTANLDEAKKWYWRAAGE